MKRLKLKVVVAILALFGSGVALAMEPPPSAERGMALFNDTGLGTSGRSCGTCHPGGKGLEMAAEDEDLADTINKCIVKALKGEGFDPDSAEMQSLVLYIKSLATE